MAFQAGAIVSKLTLDKSKFSASIKTVQKQTRSLGGWVKKNSGQFKAMGLAAAAAGTAVILVFRKMVKQYVETGDMIHKMAIRTGFAAETLSELAYAAEISGADITMLEKGVKKMSKTIVDAGVYSLETYIRVFEGLGLEVEELLQMKPEQQFLTIGAAIAKMENQTLKTAAAVDIFGRAGTMLLPFFAEGAEGMANLREEAHTLGIIFDEEAAAKAAKLKDAQTALTGSVKGLSIAILNDLIPVITGVTKNFTDWFVSSRKDARGWTEVLLSFFKLIAQGVKGLMLSFNALQALVFQMGQSVAKMFREYIEKLIIGFGMLESLGVPVKGIIEDLVQAWADLRIIEDGYWKEAEKHLNTMADIIIAYDKFVALLDKIKIKTKEAKKEQKSFGTVITESSLPAMRYMNDVLKAALPEMDSYTFTLGEMTEAQQEFAMVAAQEFAAMEATIKGFVDAVLNSLERWAIGQIIVKALASAIPFPFNLLAAAAGIIAVKLLFAGIKSMEEGGTIEREGIYHLHRGEEVVPAAPAQAAPAVGSRSAVTYNITFRVQALDSIDVERWFRDVGAKQIEEIFRRNQGGIAEKSERYLSQYRR